MPQSPVPVRLREARLRNGLSQKELGIRAGIDESSASPRLNQYETGKHTPDYNTLVQIAKVLKVPVPYFYCEDDRLAQLILAYDKLSAKAKNQLLAQLEQ
jgi:transcriptional regulator with XRE-family HTH domain